MKKFFAEFKKFISRGNVIDLAVGVVMGTAFTAIVTALTVNILQPLINALISLISGGQGLEGAITLLRPVYDETGALILNKSIYIDWGALITAIINFFLIAIVLFLIVKGINAFEEGNKKLSEKNKEKIRIHKLKKFEEKNEKRVAKGLKPLETPKELLPKEPEPEPVVVVPEDIQLLRDIKELLKEKK